MDLRFAKDFVCLILYWLKSEKASFTFASIFKWASMFTSAREGIRSKRLQAIYYSLRMSWVFAYELMIQKLCFLFPMSKILSDVAVWELCRRCLHFVCSDHTSTFYYELSFEWFLGMQDSFARLFQSMRWKFMQFTYRNSGKLIIDCSCLYIHVLELVTTIDFSKNWYCRTCKYEYYPPLPVITVPPYKQI